CACCRSSRSDEAARKRSSRVTARGRVLWCYTMTRPPLPRWLSAVAFLAALFVALPASGQTSPFRITHSVDKGAQAQVTVTGRVFNEARADAIDVYVTAEALDSGGKILASGVAYIGSVS